MAHELAYPWGRGGWRGRLWATTQRGALIELLRAAAAVIVTSEDQQRWLGPAPGSHGGLRRWRRCSPTCPRRAAASSAARARSR